MLVDAGSAELISIYVDKLVCRGGYWHGFVLYLIVNVEVTSFFLDARDVGVGHVVLTRMTCCEVSPGFLAVVETVSYTHLTLPTKRIV